jgi:hypothetical protein
MLAERMKSELFEPPINMLFVDARVKWRGFCLTCMESSEYSTDDEQRVGARPLMFGVSPCALDALHRV